MILQDRSTSSFGFGRSLRFCCFGALFSLAALVPVAQASEPGGVQVAPVAVESLQNSPDIAPDQLVSAATDALLHRINTASSDEKAIGLDFYKHLVETTIGPFVDFETIAYRVMGRNVYDMATGDQRMAFVAAFKDSLLETYAKGISTYDNQTITISPYEGITTKNGVARARVGLEIQPKGGNPFPIVYTMVRDEERGWLLENMHLDGINVGSTFRSQFQQSLKKYNNDIDLVIQNWGQGS